MHFVYHQLVDGGITKDRHWSSLTQKMNSQNRPGHANHVHGWWRRIIWESGSSESTRSVVVPKNANCERLLGTNYTTHTTTHSGHQMPGIARRREKLPRVKESVVDDDSRKGWRHMGRKGADAMRPRRRLRTRRAYVKGNARAGRETRTWTT